MAGLSLKRSRQAPAEETSAFAGVAERFRRGGDLDRAIALCREGLQRFPDLLSARVTLGWALLDKGEFAEASTELQQVLKRAPDNLAAIRGLAELHDRIDGSDGAMESWQADAEPAETPSAPPVPDPAEVEVAEATFADASPASADADQLAADVPESALSEQDPVSDAPDLTTPSAEAALEPTASEPSARAEVWGEVALASEAAREADLAEVSSADSWEEPSPVASESDALPQAIDHAHVQEAWEDVSAAIVEAVVAGPQTIELDAAGLSDADAELASEAVTLDAQAAVVSEETDETRTPVVDAGIVLDEGDTDEAAELERLLATVELADSTSGSEVVVEDVDLDLPVALVAPADAVPLAELVTAADLAMADAGEPVSFSSLDSSAALPDSPSGIVALVAAEPVVHSSETADEAQALFALPPLDPILSEAPTTPASEVQSLPASDERPEEPAVAQVVELAAEPVVETVVEPVVELVVEPAAETAAERAAEPPPAEPPAAPEVVSYQPSAAYEPATWHQPAAWHAPASVHPPTTWPDEVTTPVPPPSRHAATPRVSRKRAQVVALEKLLRRVEARRLRLQAQSVA